MAEVVAQVYGLSLFEVAQEASQVKEILDELSQVCELMDQFPGFQNLLGSPVLSKEERVKLVEEDFHGQINPYLLNFLKLLAESGRMSHLKEIADEYRSLYYEQENIQEVTAVTAVAMPKELQEKLAAQPGRSVCHGRCCPQSWQPPDGRHRKSAFGGCRPPDCCRAASFPRGTFAALTIWKAGEMTICSYELRKSAVS